MRRRMVASLTSLCLLLLPLSGPVLAAQAGGAAQPPPRYKLKPGDRLTIDVSPQGLQYNRVLTVQPDGYIYYPVVGELYVTGLTVPEVQDALFRGLAPELKNYRVTVSLEPAPVPTVATEAGKVVVLGHVRAPNVIQMQKNFRLVELIAAAGGVTELGDASRIAVTRENGTTVLADLGTAQGRDLLLQPGDTVIIPGLEAAGLTATVLGMVGKPGPTTFTKPGATVLDLLKEAGGPTEKAMLKGGLLRRVGQLEPTLIDLTELWLKGDMSLNLRLVQGDVLVVPEIGPTSTVYVYGAVSKPDAYPLKGGEKLIDILVKGGAPLEAANLNKVTLNRLNPDGTRTQVKLDLKKLQRSGDISVAQVELQAGDIIMVPIRPPRKESSFEKVAQIAAIVNILTSLQQLFGLQSNNRNRNP